MGPIACTCTPDAMCDECGFASRETQGLPRYIEDPETIHRIGLVLGLIDPLERREDPAA